MPPLKKSEKLMLGLIGASIITFIVMDPYYFIWKAPPGTEPAVTTPPPAAAKAPRSVETAAGTGFIGTRRTERIKFDDWGRDPFLQTRRGFEVSRAVSSLKLAGISVRGSDRYALINSNIVRRGQTVEGFLVKDIERDRVILEAKGQQYVLTWGG